MPSPFPGMDPYLEQPHLWPDVHNRLITEIGDVLADALAPKYIVSTHEEIVIDRVTVSEKPIGVVPDVNVAYPQFQSEEFHGLGEAVAVAPITLLTTNPMEVEMPFRQVSIELRHAPDEQVVTIIELLSPINKRPGDKRYEDKRNRILEGNVHLLEIDLLRAGQRIKVRDALPDAPYFVFLSRGDQRPNCEVRAIQLSDPLPVIPVPLLREDGHVPLSLNAALAKIYDMRHFNLRIDYTADPDPPLAEEDAAWADTLLREKGLRS